MQYLDLGILQNMTLTSATSQQVTESKNKVIN